MILQQTMSIDLCIISFVFLKHVITHFVHFVSKPRGRPMNHEDVEKIVQAFCCVFLFAFVRLSGDYLVTVVFLWNVEIKK